MILSCSAINCSHLSCCNTIKDKKVSKHTPTLVTAFFFRTGEVYDLSSKDYEESAGRSKRRFFLILATYFAISENQLKMKGLHMLWWSVSDAIISRKEMISALKKNLQEQVRIYFVFVTLQCGGKMVICQVLRI
ncbi:hypothetical protein AVEN_64542-1 [Araneus ventricosus]|uniref:Uncharacterized protein n=1 Tax=Araneus ventricosus TaxID=182803 RepID=A0A4Y2INV5_ARAVE|nr:hypothetical protein AVEN_64542-1 [Araneus ventricosus]